MRGEIVRWPGAWRPDTADRVDLLVLSVGQLGLVALVFSFMGEQLARRVKNVATVRSYAVYVIAHARETALLERTCLGLHEFLEPIAGQLLVFDVVRFVLVHVSLVLEGEPATWSPAMEVRGPLANEGTVIGSTALGSSKSLETLLYDSRILAMVIGVHLHVRRRYVNFIAILVDTVVVRLFSIVGAGTARMSLRAIIRRRIPHEAVLQRFVPLFVPLEMPDHFLLFHKDPTTAIQTVKMLSATELLTIRATAFLTRRVPPHVSGVIDYWL